MSFAGEQAPELYETCFYHPVLADERRCIRGKLSGAYIGYETFQWTKAVQALCLLFLRALEQSMRLPEQQRPGCPFLIGAQSSLALSLDYALEKQTRWLADMFGSDSQGHIIAKRLIARTNPGKKRNGPVALSLNTRFLPTSSIFVRWNFCQITGRESLQELLSAIEKSCAATTRGAAGQAPPSVRLEAIP